MRRLHCLLLLTNNLISYHIFFLLFTLRLLLPFNLFKKVSLLLEITGALLWLSEALGPVLGVTPSAQQTLINACHDTSLRRIVGSEEIPKDLVFISERYFRVCRRLREPLELTVPGVSPGWAVPSLRALAPWPRVATNSSFLGRPCICAAARL